MKNKTVLVTGVTGFLGSHILEALMENKNIRLIVACRDASKLLAGFQGELRLGDLTDATYCRELVQDVDVICHAAAWTSLWGHREQEQRLYLEPTKQLIEAAIEAGVERFIFDSSVVISGSSRAGAVIADNKPVVSSRFWPHIDIVSQIETFMQTHSTKGTTMVALRCGHFVGARYHLGLLSLMLPRLKTHLVPWVGGGKSRVPLVDGRDIAQAFALAVYADGLQGFESFNICGPSFPSMREVIDFLHAETGVARPHYGVPLSAAYLFGWFMEKLNPLLPGDPFLTRSIVYLGEDWYAPSELAAERLGYLPRYDWKTALRYQLGDMQRQGYPRISLVDAIR